MSATALPSPPPLENLLADGPLALFLDFDGTLVDLAPTPGAIAVPPGFGRRLISLSERLDGRLAVVSGRSIADLERHCGSLAIHCAGSHGAECRRADGGLVEPAPVGLTREVLDEIACFARVNGVDYEAKPYGAALHSRAAPEMEGDCALFMADLAAAHGLAVKRGKRVAELVRPGTDKGSAVRKFMSAAPFAGSCAVFVGDDLTDEDGFAACGAWGGFGIAVGPRPTENARFGLADPAAVQQWLGL